MKGSRFIAMVMLLLLIFACFISIPVFAEGPWDADGDPSSPNDSDNDTIGHNGDDELQALRGEEPDEHNWLESILLKVTINWLIYTITHPVKMS